jgi:hypothetical protein
MYPASELFQRLVKNPMREFDTKVIINGVEHGSNEVVEWDIVETITESESYTIGNAIPTKFELKLYTQSIFPTNAEMKPYIRLTDSGDTEWMPLGVFYVDSRKESEGGTWNFVCYDKLMQANQPWETELYLPASMFQVVEEICDVLEIQLAPDTSLMFEVPLMTHEFTMRQVLGYIAGCQGANAKINRNGELAFIKPRKGQVI